MQFVSPSAAFLFCSLLGGAPSAVAAAPTPPQATGPAAQRATSPPQSEQVQVEEKIVVTADRNPEDIRNVGSSVSVITSEEIAASGARWLIDVLDFAPGISVVRSGPPGALTEVYIRGAASGHTLFLIDGVKANSPTSGSYDLAAMPLAADQIERVEIVRGPQSTLYGSQAIGGVINVITRSGRGAGTLGLEGDGGSYGTGRAHASAGGELDAVRYTGSVSYFDSNGFSAADRANGNTENDGYRNLSYNARVDYESKGGARLRGYVRGFDGDVQFDGFDFVAGPVDALRNVQSTRETYAGVAADYGNGSFATKGEFSVSDATSESVTPDDFFSRFALDSSIYEIDWQNEISLPASQRLTAGVEYRREQATIESVSTFGPDGYDERVDVAGLYAQDRVRIAGRASLTGGFRYEHHSAFGSKWTGRGTGAVELTGALRLHGSLGSAFKAPTLNDLYYPGFSNPDLRPESSVGLDVGIEAAGSGVRADVTYFRNDITDLIQFDAATFRPQNIGAVLAQGLEVAVDAAAGARTTLSGQYTFTSAIPDGSDEQLVRRPRHQGGIRATRRLTPGLRAFGELRFEAGRFDSGTGGRVSMSSFAVVNLAADYRLSEQVRLRGRVENLFDTEYEEVIGYGTAGISGYLGLSFTLARN